MSSLPDGSETAIGGYRIREPGLRGCFGGYSTWGVVNVTGALPSRRPNPTHSCSRIFSYNSQIRRVSQVAYQCQCRGIATMRTPGPSSRPQDRAKKSRAGPRLYSSTLVVPRAKVSRNFPPLNRASRPPLPLAKQGWPPVPARYPTLLRFAHPLHRSVRELLRPFPARRFTHHSQMGILLLRPV